MRKLSKSKVNTTRWIYFFIVFLGISLYLPAQSSAEKLISIECKQEPLSSALVKLQKLSDYKVLFTYEDVQNVKVSISEKNKTVGEIMSLLLKETTLTYTIKGKYISIIPAKKQNQAPTKKEIKGQVTDEMNQPLPGASIHVIGTQISTASGLDGEFTITVPDENSFIEVSFIGMETQTISIGGKNVVDIILKESAQQLAATIVTGYQTLSRERSTGAFAKLESEDLEIKRIENLSSVLEGQIAGYVDGSLRGISTMNALGSPLVVIDGFPVENTQINKIGEPSEGMPDLNPEDIESITVLKDAAAASIYGARAANGIIVITTKKAKRGNTDISFSSTLTYQPYSYYIKNRTNAADVIQMQRDWALTTDLVNGGANASKIASDIREAGKYSRGVDILLNMYTNEISMDEGNKMLDNLARMGHHYYNQVEKYAKRDPLYQQYNLRLAKASDMNSFNFSTTYWKNQFEDVNSDEWKVGVNLTNSMKITKWMNLDLGAYLKYGKANTQTYDMYAPGFSIMPYDGLVGEDGSYLSALTQNDSERNDNIKENGLYDETITAMDELNYNIAKTRTLENRTHANLKVDFTSWLNYNIMFQYEISEMKYEQLSEAESQGMRSMINNYISESNGVLTYNLPQGNSFNTSVNSTTAYTFRHQLNMSKTLGDKHEIAWIGGHEMRHTLLKLESNTYYGYDPELLSWQAYNEKALASGISGIFGWKSLKPDNSKYKKERLNRFISLYSNGSYTYDQRYTLSGSIRWDRSNLWATGSKYQNTPIWSMGGSWNINREAFFKSDIIDMLRARISYGIGGNIWRGSAPFLTATYYSSYQFGGLAGLVQSPPNPDIRWEKTTVTNIGIDFALFKNRLSGSIDYYNKFGEDLLADVPLSATQGFGYSTMQVNNAEMINRGFEVTLHGEIIKNKNFGWRATFLYSYNRNKVESFNNTTELVNSMISLPSSYPTIGEPLHGLYAYKWAGLNEDGDPQIYDRNGEKLFEKATTSKDLYYAGSTTPVHSGTFTNILRYKDFEFSAMLTIAAGHKLRGTDIPTINMTTGQINSTYKSIANRWKSAGDEAYTNVPRLLYSHQNTGISSYSYRTSLYSYSDLFIYDASNVRIKNISFAYRLPKIWCKKAFLSSARLQFNIENLAVIAFDSKARYNLGAYTKPNYVWGLYLNF